MSTTRSLNIYGVLSETNRIVNAHSRHFLALSVLFLLPLSLSMIIYPFIHPTSLTTHFRRSLYFFQNEVQTEEPTLCKSQIIFQIVYALCKTLLSILATVSITHSTFHGFYGRPVKFISSLKSIILSFFPLVATLIVNQLILGFIIFAFASFSFLMYTGIASFGAEMDYNSPWVILLVILMIMLIICVTLYYTVVWHLASVVVVVESQWGYSALKRSSYLVQGMRRVVFAIILLFAILFGIMSKLYLNLMPSGVEFTGKWINCAFILQTVVYAGLVTIFMLYSVAVNAVLYMYCKASHGESAADIAAEFSGEYVNLPFDDGKLAHVVYVV